MAMAGSGSGSGKRGGEDLLVVTAGRPATSPSHAKPLHLLARARAELCQQLQGR